MTLLTHPELQTKAHLAVAPISRGDTDATTSAAIDTAGFHYVEIIPLMGVGDTALATTVTTSDTSTGTYTAVTDEASTPAAVSIPHLATDDGTLKRALIRTDRPSMKRWIKVTITGTGGTASLCGVVVVLHGPHSSDQFTQDTFTYLL